MGKLGEVMNEEKPESQTEEKDPNDLGLTFPLDEDKHTPKAESDEDDDVKNDETGEEVTEKKEGDSDAVQDEEGKESKESDESREEVLEPSEEEQSAFTPREKGLYEAMKKERAARQEAEKAAEFLKLQAKYGQKPTAEQKEEKEEVIDEDPVEALLKSKESDEPVTAAELRQAFALQKQQQSKKEDRVRTEQEKAQREHQRQINELNEVENSMKQTFADYDEAQGLAIEMMKQYRGLQLEFNQVMKDKGAQAAAMYAYNLGKSHKMFGTKKTDDKAKEQEKVKRVIENSEKPKTSANASNGTKKPTKWSNDDLENMDADELGQVLAGMSQAEYVRVPKSIRRKAMAGL